MDIEGIDKALREGCRLRAYISGGNIRVVRITDNDVLRGYGEHPDVYGALQYASADYLSVGRSLQPLYIFGGSDAENDLDRWTLVGGGFEAWCKGSDTVLQLRRLASLECPSDVMQRLKTTTPVTWERRGFTYCSYVSARPRGGPCVATEVVFSPEGVPRHRAFHFRVTKTGKGNDFWSAMDAAFKADEVEVTTHD